MSKSDLENISYSGIYDQPVTLHDGLYEGQPFVEGGASRPRVQLLTRLVATGDLTGNGVQETAVFLAENSGGSGVSIYLAIIGTGAGHVENLATVFIGNRTKIRSLKIKSSRVVLQVIAVGDGEPMCCGTAKRQLSFSLVDDSLVPHQALEMGNFSIADLGTEPWYLAGLSTDSPIPTGIEITAKFSEGKISGSSGCNQYFANIKSPLPYSFSVETPATTRKLCLPLANETEERYLFLLEKVTHFGFIVGDLVLSYRDGDDFGQLRFTDQR